MADAILEKPLPLPGPNYGIALCLLDRGIASQFLFKLALPKFEIIGRDRFRGGSCPPQQFRLIANEAEQHLRERIWQFGQINRLQAIPVRLYGA